VSDSIWIAVIIAAGLFFTVCASAKIIGQTFENVIRHSTQSVSGLNTPSDRVVDTLVTTTDRLMAQNAMLMETLSAMSEAGHRILIERNQTDLRLAQVEAAHIEATSAAVRSSFSTEGKQEPQAWSDTAN
jgi:hypothetical protein